MYMRLHITTFSNQIQADWIFEAFNSSSSGLHGLLYIDNYIHLEQMIDQIYPVELEKIN